MENIGRIMSYKSRSNWNIKMCLKKCANKNIKCDRCFRFSYYAPLSICCNVLVYVGGKGITHYYVCSKCKQACKI